MDELTKSGVFKAESTLQQIAKGYLMAATEVTAKRMNMTEIMKKAKAIGIDPGKMKKAELIRSIQIAEGCTGCFGTSDGQCAYAECFFMQDCFKISLARRL